MSSYSFIDTIDRTHVDNLPAEAVAINGTYIENIISGYRTLYTTGRESLAREMDTSSQIATDGELFKSKRYSARHIIVGFQLVAESDEEFRSKFNRLNSLLSIGDDGAEFIFNDERDKFFNGHSIIDCEVEPGLNKVTGEWEIYCPDPFKYSTTESGPVTLLPTYDVTGLDEYNPNNTYNSGDMCKYKQGVEFVPYVCKVDGTTGLWIASKWDVVNSSAFTVNYDGGYKTYPRFEVDFATDESADGTVGYNADCGFVQFAKAYGDDFSRIQFGDDSEQQTDPTGWRVSFLKNTLGSFVNRSSGTHLGWNDDATAVASAKGLSPRYGTAATTYHGSFLRRTAEAAHDFTLSWTQETYLSSKSQTLGFIMAALDANDNIIAGVRMRKGNTTTKEGFIDLIVDGTTMKTFEKVDFGYEGPFGWTTESKSSTKISKDKKTGTVSASSISRIRATTNYIKRKDNQITIKLAHKKYTYAFYPDSETPVARVGIFLAKYKGKASPAANRVRFAKFSGTSESNTFSSGDILDVFCSSADIRLNESTDLSLGDVGNEWGDMYLDVGDNIIFAAYSEWCQLPPTFKMYYRKRWI